MHVLLIQCISMCTKCCNCHLKTFLHAVAYMVWCVDAGFQPCKLLCDTRSMPRIRQTMCQSAFSLHTRSAAPEAGGGRRASPSDMIFLDVASDNAEASASITASVFLFTTQNASSAFSPTGAPRLNTSGSVASRSGTRQLQSI